MQKNVGPCATLLADTGYYSAGNVEACEKAGIEPIIAMGRQPHRERPGPPRLERPFLNAQAVGNC